MDVTQRRLPVHVLTGFLGSGKTTLLSALLRQPALRDTLVIVNEFGEVGFDHLLLAEAQEEVIVQLDGGCACCIVRGDLLRTLTAARQEFGGNGARRFARVIIETSGLATPDAIVQTLMLERQVSSLYRLGRIAATFDGVHGAETLAAYAEARAQMAAAEIVVLTKFDLLDEKQPATAVATIRTFNPGAELCPAPEFLRRAGRWMDDAEQFDTSLPKSAATFSRGVAEPFQHTQNIQTFALRCPQALDRRAFNEWMCLRLRFREGRILRVKGVVQLHDSKAPVFVHGVQQMFHPPRVLPDRPGSDAGTHLVFITDGITREAVERSFAEHVLQSRSSPAGGRAQHERDASG